MLPIRHGKIMIIDDDTEIRSLLADFLGSQGYECFTYPLAKEALKDLQTGGRFAYHTVDLIITDLKIPEMDGLQFIQRVKTIHPRLPVILITAFGSVETAIEAIRAGAYDYVVKPFKLAEINLTVSRAIHLRQVEQENVVLRKEIRRDWSLSEVIGKSPAMLQIFDTIKKVASVNANILIYGESGTGKQVIARAVHNSGNRAHHPFVHFSCTSCPDESMLETELFGHAAGLFANSPHRKRGLLEEANDGTLYIEEIGHMDLTLQAKLLKVMQDKSFKTIGEDNIRPINIRFIASTTQDLKEAVQQGRFREDLYLRLNVVPIVVPPLRHRKEDIPLLTEHFLKKYTAAHQLPQKRLAKSVLAQLIDERWDGNVRELETSIERAIVLSTGDQIESLVLPQTRTSDNEDFFGRATEDLPTLQKLEERYMKLVLDKTGGRKEKAAQILGINRRTLYRKEREYGFVEDSDHHNENLDHNL